MLKLIALIAHIAGFFHSSEHFWDEDLDVHDPLASETAGRCELGAMENFDDLSRAGAHGAADVGGSSNRDGLLASLSCGRPARTWKHRVGNGPK